MASFTVHYTRESTQREWLANRAAPGIAVTLRVRNTVRSGRSCETVLGTLCDQSAKVVI